VNDSYERNFLNMKIINAKEAPAGPNPHNVKAAQVHNSEHALAVHLTLEPGQSLKRHITPVDVFFYVLEGTGIVEIGDEKQSVGPDSLIESPARIPHCWYNQSNQRLRVLVVKVPRPTEKTQLL
jgi:quercetin dioxygenase-like cupin family protein